MAQILLFLLSLLCVEALHRENVLFPGENWESGLIDLGNGGDDIFYYYFEAREPRPNKERPLVLWLTGGPGCSSSLGLFMEMGPYIFNHTKSSKGVFEYYRNLHSWNNFADLLFIDQPVGTGFSRAKVAHKCGDQICVAENFYAFFKKFLVKHPELKNRPFYLTGESYAGKYVPSISAYLLKIADPDINVQGLIIGGGMINRFIQRSLDPLFFYSLGYYNIFKYVAARTSTMLCELTHALGYQSIALPLCVKMRPYFFPPEIVNDDDISENKTYDEAIEYIERYINSSTIKETLGVPDRNFIMCSNVVEKDFFGDFLVSQDKTIGEVLEKGVKVMLYIGMHDSGSHWIGTEQVANGVPWKGKDGFNKATYEPWKADGQHFADRRRYDKFSFVKLFDAGHLSPMNQPFFCLKMLEEFVFDKQVPHPT